ncbi:MAG: STAS domain-containing protein [Rubrivivax sp.]|nr:STAS domain-containing protein [Rubrivivax sp.]
MDIVISGPAATVTLGPELTIAQAAAWRDMLGEALASTPGDLALDLSSVTDIDSAGIQLLLAARRSVLARGAHLALAEVPPLVRESLAVLGLDEQLQALGHREGAGA